VDLVSAIAADPVEQRCESSFELIVGEPVGVVASGRPESRVAAFAEQAEAVDFVLARAGVCLLQQRKAERDRCGGGP
jgi:hypothetical protein